MTNTYKNKGSLMVEILQRFMNEMEEIDRVIDAYHVANECQFCNDTGIRHVPNGEDDYDVVICECSYGKSN